MKMLAGFLLATLLLSACNTIHGIGQDIQRGGEKGKVAANSEQQKK